jgi:predicted TPR repeat methyltransferase
VTGLDPAPAMLELARARVEGAGYLSKCAFVKGLFPHVDLEPHDHVIVMGVMDYVADPAAFLGALLPLVRESAVLSFSSRHWFRTPIRKVRYTLRRCPVYFYGKEHIHRLCASAGFRDIHIYKIPGAGMDYHVCLKP